MAPPFNVLLVAIGSAGDVHPFIGLGGALRRRGHRVTLLANDHFQSSIEAADLRFGSLGTDADFQRILENPDLWNPRKGFHLIAREALVPLIRPVYQSIHERFEPGTTIVGASTLALGARVAQEKLGIPTATVHLQPAVFHSAIDMPLLPALPAQVLRWPVPVKRALWRLADWTIDRLVGPSLNAFRKDLGLTPVKRIFDVWCHSPDCVIGLFPEWFAPLQPDWPRQVTLTGFPLFDDADTRPMPPPLERFLAEGSAPIVFTIGSANAHAQAFFRAAIQACAILKRRGVLVTRFSAPREDLPPYISLAEYAPFSRLFPRAAAVVHHGGIGTTAQALAAGVPQLIVPLSHDQPDNARRVKRLGLGLTLHPRDAESPALARALTNLMRNSALLQACRETAGTFKVSDPVEQTANLMESLLTPVTSLPVYNSGLDHHRYGG